LSTSDALKQLNEAMGIFRSTTRDVSKKSGTFFDTPEEIEKYRASVNEALKKVLPILRTLESQQLSKTDKAVYDKTVLEIAKYFDNTLDGVKNRHYRNYDLAFDLALSLIKDDLKKQNITIPIRPSQKEVLQSLKSLDPKLQKKIETDMRAGYDLGQILSNPQVRSQWESVYEKVYSKYEDEMQTLLKSLKDKRPTMASVE
jgi:exonuclease I